MSTYFATSIEDVKSCLYINHSIIYSKTLLDVLKNRLVKRGLIQANDSLDQATISLIDDILQRALFQACVSPNQPAIGLWQLITTYCSDEKRVNIFNQVIATLWKMGWIKTQKAGTAFVNLVLNVDKVLDILSVGSNRKIAKQDWLKIRMAVRLQQAFHHYSDENEDKELLSKYGFPVGHGRKTRHTGLKRWGFKYISENCKYTVDLKYLRKYQTEVLFELVKGLDYSHAKDWEAFKITKIIIDKILAEDPILGVGKATIDSRGRSNFSGTQDWLNHQIKVCRALIVIPPHRLTNNGKQTVYQFVANLLGCKAKTLKERAWFGKQAIQNHTLPPLEFVEEDIIKENEDGTTHVVQHKFYKNLAERIWLERIYDSMRDITHWTTPIEVDARSSVVQIMSVLLNYHAGMRHVNLFNDHKQVMTDTDVLQDGYVCTYVPNEYKSVNIPRNWVKYTVTPVLYGYQGDFMSALKKKGIHEEEVPTEALELLGLQFERGLFAPLMEWTQEVLNRFDPLIFEGSYFSKYNTYNILEDKFQVYCSKFRPFNVKTDLAEEDDRLSAKVLCTEDKVYAEIETSLFTHCDVSKFGTFHPSMLIHNIDSQIANYVAEQAAVQNKWLITIHDAFIISPNEGNFIRSKYCDFLYRVYIHRKEIRKQFLYDISGEDTDWDDVDTDEVPTFSGTALK